jgi:hypothetical protein
VLPELQGEKAEETRAKGDRRAAESDQEDRLPLKALLVRARGAPTNALNKVHRAAAAASSAPVERDGLEADAGEDIVRGQWGSPLAQNSTVGRLVRLALSLHVG